MNNHSGRNKAAAASPDGKAVTVIIPVFNEEKSLTRVVEEVEAILKEKEDWRYEIVVIDDASTDNTAKIAADLPARVLTHPRQAGYGASIKHGIKKSRYDYVLIIDGDGTYPTEAVASLLEAAPKFDMVVGARTGANVAIPPVRRFPKWLLKKLADYLAGMKIPDLNSGLRVFRKGIALKYFNLFSPGFSFTTTITLAFLNNDYSVEYIPIDYYKREGKSKFRPFQDTFSLISLIIRTSLYFSPLKIFVPAGLFLIGCGLALLLTRFFIGGVGMVTTVVLLTAGFQVLALGLLADLVDKRSQR